LSFGRLKEENVTTMHYEAAGDKKKSTKEDPAEAAAPFRGEKKGAALATKQQKGKLVGV